MSKSIYEKLRTIPDGYLALLSFLCMLIPILHPLGMPLTISETTKGFYNTLVNLPEGSIVMVEGAGSLSNWDEFEASMLATYKLLFSLPVKILSWGPNTDGPIITDMLMKKIEPEKNFGKVYGRDYLILGYIPGGEMAIAAIAADTHGVATKDFYGNDLSQYPLWDECRNADSYAIIISTSTSCLNMDMQVRQWYSIHGKKILEINMACCSPMSVVYFPDIMPGGLWGAKGGTELEVLSGFPGPGARLSDASNLGVMPFLLFLVLANIGYLGSKYASKEKEEIAR